MRGLKRVDEDLAAADDVDGFDGIEVVVGPLETVSQIVHDNCIRVLGEFAAENQVLAVF